MIGRTYGVGDGSTTFNLPDLRGRTIFGIGNMGGVPSSRLNSAIVSTLGAVGGAQSHQPHRLHVWQHRRVRMSRSPCRRNQFGLSIQVASNGHSHDFSFSVPTSTTTTVPPVMALNYIIRT